MPETLNRLQLEEAVFRPFIDDAPLPSLRGNDPELHQLWDRWKAWGIQYGTDGLGDSDNRHSGLEAMAWERIDGNRAWYATDEDEQQHLEVVRERAQRFGALVRELGSERAALERQQERYGPREIRAEMEARWPNRIQLEEAVIRPFIDDAPLPSLRGNDPELHQLWDNWKNVGIQYGNTRVDWQDPPHPELFPIAQQRITAGAALNATVQGEHRHLNRVRVLAQCFGALVAEYGSEEAALENQKELYAPIETRAAAEAARRSVGAVSPLSAMGIAVAHSTPGGGAQFRPSPTREEYRDNQNLRNPTYGTRPGLKRR